MCMFCRSLFVLLYFFLLTIVLSVLLRYTDSDYPFDTLCLQTLLAVNYDIQCRSTLHWFTHGVLSGSTYQDLMFCVVFGRPLLIFLSVFLPLYCCGRGRRGHDTMIVGFPITYAISAYDH
jgi:hypothetical protein